MILVIFWEARPRAGAIKATQATQPTDLMVFPARDQRGQVVRKTLPRWLLPLTECRIPKDRTGPDLDERPLYLSMSPNQAIVAEKSIRFFPARRRSTVDHSLVPSGARGRWFRACLPGGY